LATGILVFAKNFALFVSFFAKSVKTFLNSVAKIHKKINWFFNPIKNVCPVDPVQSCPSY
jgi:hypothetical protein